MIFEPKWKSLLANTIKPIFTPQQCQDIINMGHKQKSEEAKVGHTDKAGGNYDTKKRITTISWIPFKEMPEMYHMIDRTMQQANGNHFGFDGMQITEYAQYTEYPKGGFYDWHVDNDVNCAHEPPVRKISMTCLLSPENQFEGGDLELMAPGKYAQLKQGHAIVFASFLNHRIKKVTRGMRQSLVVWFGGKPFR